MNNERIEDLESQTTSYEDANAKQNVQQEEIQ